MDHDPLLDRVESNPVSAVTQASRELFGNLSAGAVESAAWSLQHPVRYTLLWTVAVIAVFAPLSIRRSVGPGPDRSWPAPRGAEFVIRPRGVSPCCLAGVTRLLRDRRGVVGCGAAVGRADGCGGVAQDGVAAAAGQADERGYA